MLTLIAVVSLAVFFLAPFALRVLIRRRLKGYKREANQVDPRQPRKLGGAVRVAVIGGGVAGLVSAVTLARRGYQVSLFEKNPYLGGKLGSWPVRLESGREVFVSHGFHAFFKHYYNLNVFLDSLGLRRGFASIGDYVIMGRDGQLLRFANLKTTPIFNLFSLMRAGMFSLKDALKAPGRDLYGVFLEYDQEKTFATLDHLSYAEFSERAQVPPRLKLAFNTFARAFFADESKLSFAELVKSFHFYYLSHDGGLVYDYPKQDYHAGILTPLTEELKQHGAALHLETPVESLKYEEGALLVNEARFDRVVVATDVVGTNRILGKADSLPEAMQTQMNALRPGQRYSVLRLWLDKDVRGNLPVFLITERREVLDSVTFYHRFEEETQAEVARAQKSGEALAAVVELHCYSVPDELADEEVRGHLLSELLAFFPELEGVTVLDEYFQLRQDFTAFHVGRDAGRPTVRTDVPGLVCAGDWVKLPFPAMLLEAACASGLLAANEILSRDGLCEEQVYSVPLKGLMAGMPAPPARKVLDP